MAPWRAAGLAVVAGVALLGASQRPDPLLPNLLVTAGVLSLAAFLWLAASGFFGYGAPDRQDWPGLVAFAVALIVRELFTLHSVEGIHIQFVTAFEIPHGPVGKHSVLHLLWQLFFLPIAPDPQRLMLRLNGILGAFAALPLYLFARRRLASRAGGFLVALFFATYPLAARFAPTDGPYSLLLATWFSGLALLSAPNPGARALLGGAGLLAIAATLRLEGTLFLVASLLMLDARSLIDAARRHRTAAISAVMLIGALVALQMYFFLPPNTGGTKFYLPENASVNEVLNLILWPVTRNGPAYALLFAAGVLSGIVGPRRLGLLAFFAMLIVVAPVVNSMIASGLHRLVPAWALQALVAGVGAHAITDRLLATRWGRWTAFAPGLIALLALVAHRDDLTRPYVFTDEYELVRSHLAPHGIIDRDCILLHFRSSSDEDVHNFDAVVPGMRVVDCGSADCAAEAASRDCVYYLRSAAAFFHASGIPSTCAHDDDVASRGPSDCRIPAAASFERSVSLEPIEVREIDLHETFPDWRRNYPPRAEAGVFRVRSSARVDRDDGRP